MSMLFPNGHFAFLDLETTGARAGLDRITEVAIIEVLDGEVIDQYQTLLNPGTYISSFITSLTGIDNEMVASAPRFEDIAEDLMARLLGRTLVAHNARFDHGFLKNEFRRVGLSYRTKVLCTVKLSRQLLPEVKSHSLDSLIHLHGLFVESRHRAMGDTDLIVQLVAKYSRDLGVDTVQAAVQKQLKAASLPPLIDAEVVEALPNQPGVYQFYDGLNVLLYVGKSIKIRERVKSHFSGDHASDKELEMSRQISRIDYITTGGDLGAQLLEARMIKELNPIYNRQLRRNKLLWYLLLSANDDGYQTVSVVSGRSLPPQQLDKALGLFRSRRSAEDILRKVADEHQLCHRLLGLEKSRKGACFAYQLKRCHGACAGKEQASDYNTRLETALAQWRIKVWPHPGPLVIEEKTADKTEFHLVHHWCHLASAEYRADLPAHAGRAVFDYDTYKILLRFFEKRPRNVKLHPADIAVPSMLDCSSSFGISSNS